MSDNFQIKLNNLYIAQKAVTGSLASVENFLILNSYEPSDIADLTGSLATEIALLSPSAQSVAQILFSAVMDENLNYNSVSSIPASGITGSLSNAYIDSSRVNNLYTSISNAISVGYFNGPNVHGPLTHASIDASQVTGSLLGNQMSVEEAIGTGSLDILGLIGNLPLENPSLTDVVNTLSAVIGLGVLLDGATSIAEAIGNNTIPASSISAAIVDINSEAWVTNSRIAPSAVYGSAYTGELVNNIYPSSIGTADIALSAITGSLIAPNTIQTANIANSAITSDKILSLDAAKVTGSIPGSQITGSLTYANIDASQINDLSDFVSSQITSSLTQAYIDASHVTGSLLGSESLSVAEAVNILASDIGDKILITSLYTINSLSGGINALKLQTGTVPLNGGLAKDDVNSFTNIATILIASLQHPENYATSANLASTIINAITSHEFYPEPTLTVSALQNDIEYTITNRNISLSNIAAHIVSSIVGETNLNTISNAIYSNNCIIDYTDNNKDLLKTDLATAQDLGNTATITSVIGGDDISLIASTITAAIGNQAIGASSISAALVEINSDAWVTNSKIAAGAVHGSSGGGTHNIAASSIGTTDIALSAITGSLIAQETIIGGNGGNIVQNSIDYFNIAYGAVHNGNIAASEVYGSAGGGMPTNIAPSSIGTADIANSAIIGSLIAASAITSDKIAASAITNALIAASAVQGSSGGGTSNIYPSSIGTNDIANSAITYSKFGFLKWKTGLNQNSLYMDNNAQGFCKTNVIYLFRSFPTIQDFGGCASGGTLTYYDQQTLAAACGKCYNTASGGETNTTGMAGCIKYFVTIE